LDATVAPVLYGKEMSFDSSSTHDAWHAALAETDRAVHAANDEHSLEAENAALRQRLDTLMAELQITRSAVEVRDAIVRELTTALRDRDADVAVAESQLGETKSQLREIESQLEAIQATRSWRLSRRAIGLIDVPRRFVHR